MSTQAADLQRLAHHEYWDGRYAEVGPGAQVHEWLRSFNDLLPFFKEHLFQTQPPETTPRILHLGSGDSTIPEDLSNMGYTNQICVDFSTVVVQNMSIKHENVQGITWKHVDVRHMDQIPSGSINVAFDKSTLDAMVHGSPWSPPDEVLDNTSQYIREVFRVLKSDGIFLYVTYQQPHFVKPLLNCKEVDWDMNVDTLGDSQSSFNYFGFVLKKASSLSVKSAEAEAKNNGSS